MNQIIAQLLPGFVVFSLSSILALMTFLTTAVLRNMPSFNQRLINTNESVAEIKDVVREIQIELKVIADQKAKLAVIEAQQANTNKALDVVFTTLREVARQ